MRLIKIKILIRKIQLGRVFSKIWQHGKTYQLRTYQLGHEYCKIYSVIWQNWKFEQWETFLIFLLLEFLLKKCFLKLKFWWRQLTCFGKKYKKKWVENMFFVIIILRVLINEISSFRNSPKMHPQILELVFSTATCRGTTS